MPAHSPISKSDSHPAIPPAPHAPPTVFALSAFPPPHDDLGDTARRLGFAGIELDESALLAPRPEGLPVLALNTAWRLDAPDTRSNTVNSWERTRAGILKAAEKARSVGAHVLTVTPGFASPGESLNAAITRIGQRLADLANALAPAAIRLAVHNGGTFARPRELWLLLEVARASARPYIPSICWSISTPADLSPIHTLNSRLALIRFHEPSPALKSFILRLRGIGYSAPLIYAGNDLPAAATLLRSAGLPLPTPNP